MKRPKLTMLTAAIVLICITALPGTLSAAEKIRLETLAIRGHSIHKNLLKMGERWKQVSDGAVKLIVYPGGTGGGESDMVGRMRIGQTQAALLSTVGLTKLDPRVTGLHSMPMMFRNLGEVDYVGEKLQPKLESYLLAKGFVVLFWADAGWVQFFSNRPATRPDEFRKLKMFVATGYPGQVDVIKRLGFTPVPLQENQILHGLQTGLIDTTPMPPFYALGSQIYRPAPHMLELNWAPLVGAAVVTKKAWDRIPARLHEPLLQATAGAGAQITTVGRTENYEAVQVMKEKGQLTVHPVTPSLAAQWRTTVQSIEPEHRRKIVPDKIYFEVERLLREYRAGQGDP